MADNIIFKVESVEIPQILNDLEINQESSNLMVYDSKDDIKKTSHNRPFRSEHFSVILVTKGMFNLNLNMLEYEASENSLFVIPPSLIRQIVFEDNAEFYAVLFSKEYLFSRGFYQNHLALFPPFNDSFQAHLFLESKNTKLLSQMIGLLKETSKESVKTTTTFNIPDLLFQALLLQLGEYYKNSMQKVKSAGENHLLSRFLPLLAKNFKEHRSVKFYSEKLSVNAKYLTQVLTKNYGKSAKEYIIEMVIMESKILLDRSNSSVGQISDQLNFANQFHFSQFFKKYTGLTPSDYRNLKI